MLGVASEEGKESGGKEGEEEKGRRMVGEEKKRREEGLWRVKGESGATCVVIVVVVVRVGHHFSQLIESTKN